MISILADTTADLDLNDGFSPVSMVEVGEDYLNSFLHVLPTIVLAMVVLFLFYVLSKTSKTAARNLASKVIDDSSLENLAGTITGVVMMVIGVFAAATIVFPGLRAGDLVAVLGLSSVAIGFAFKDIFQNFLAGILLLLQRPFVVGDQIEVSGYGGTIEQIDIRSTSLRSFGGELFVIPNAEVYGSAVTVHTDNDIRRSSFDTGIGYGEDIEEGRKVMKQALDSCERILDEPAPQVIVTGHGDSSVDFRLLYWTKSDRRSATLACDEVATKVKYALDDAGIEIPYPYRTVEFFDMTKDES